MFRHLEDPVPLTDGWVSSSVSPKRKKGKSKKGKDQKKHKEPVGFYQRKPLVPHGEKEKG